MEFDLDIALEFVEKVNPEPTPIENVAAQTGDMLIPIILCSILLLLFGLGLVFIKNAKFTSRAGHSASSSTIQKAINLIKINKFVLLAASIVLALSALFTGNVLLAKASETGGIETPSSVKAYVDTEAGSVSFDPSWLKNISDRDLMVESSNVKQFEESIPLADLKDSNFQITGMDGTIFDGHPDPDFEYVPDDLSPLKIGETSDMNFALTNVTGAQLTNLIGQKVFIIKLKFFDSIIPVPEGNDLTYNALTQVGVNSGTGYTLSGTPEAKDAGTYEATASLISGFVWEDGTYEDKTISWTIDPFDVTLTSASDSKTYDGQLLRKEEVTESPALPQGDKFAYIWNNNVVNVEDTASNNNTFIYAGQDDTKTSNYNVTTTFGTLTINPKPITLTSDGHTWDYNSEAFTCEDVNVTAGEWVEGEGATYGNFQSIIDHSETPIDNTFTCTAEGTTRLSNYDITYVYGKLQVNKVALPIKVTANSNSKMYDATVLKDSGYTFTQNVLKGSDTLKSDVSGEITNFGTTPNVVGEVHIFRGAEDATCNYNFETHENGTLEITKRPITFTSASNSWPYDATAHSDKNVTFSGEGWVSTDYATFSNFATATDYVDGGIKNTFSYEGQGETNLDNYDITVSEGTLEITKVSTPIVVTANSNSQTYNGKALTDDGFTYNQNVLKEQDKIDAKITGSQTNAGTSSNVVSEVKVMRGEDDATANYTFGEHVDGTLTVEARKITLKSQDHTWVYDGKEHSWPEVDVISGSWVEGEGAEYKDFQTLTFINEIGVQNTFVPKALKDTDFANYDIKVENGILWVIKNNVPIIIKAKSATQTYDGTALTESEYTFQQGILAEGDSLAVVIEGSQTDVGTSDNVVTSVKVMRGEEDVSDNYVFGTNMNGQLKVEPCEVTISSKTQTFTYDSTEHSCKELEVISGDFATGEGVEGYNFAKIIDYSADGVPNTYEYRGTGDTKLTNYTIHSETKKLYISKISTLLVVKANSKTQTYNATALTDNGFTYTDNVVQQNDSVVATVEGTLTDAGSVPNVVKEVKVMRGGTDASVNYNFGDHINGTLTVNPVAITLQSADQTWTYDGKTHSNTTVTKTSGEYVGSESLSFSNFAEVLDVNGEGEDNTYTVSADEGTKLSNYNITPLTGTLKVIKPETSIVVTANSQSREYDGTPLTNSGFTYTDGVVAEGENVEATIVGSVTHAADVPTPNVVQAVKVTRNGEDVSGNYNFGTHVNGELQVTKRAITLQSQSYSWTYDSTSHSWPEVVVSSGSFIGEDNVDYENFASILYATESPVQNKFDFKAKGLTDLSNYNITPDYGTLTINKVTTELIVTAKDKTKTYDGTALTQDEYTYTQNVLQGEDFLDVEISDTITDAGSTDNIVSSVKVFRGEDEVTSNYTFGTHVKGKLTVTKRPITLTSEDKSWTYDDKQHTHEVVNVTEGSWVTGQDAIYSNFATIINVGQTSNTFSMTEKEGTDFDNYEITIVNGTIKIVTKDSKIVVQASGNTKVYDGTPLTQPAYTFTEGILLTGHTLTAQTEGSITNAGTAVNKIKEGSVKVTDADGKDVTSNYQFDTYVNGELKVTARPVTLTSKSETWEYDGTEHKSEVVTSSDDGFIGDDGVDCSGFASIIDYSANGKQNTFSYEAKSGTTIANYDIQVVCGTLTITKVSTAIVLKAKDATQEYNGSALAESGFDVVQGSAKGNDVISATVSGSITEVGIAQNLVAKESIKVTRGGVDATINYTFGDPQTGTLTVTQREITLTSASETFDYTSTAHSNTTITTTGSWVGTDGVTCKNFASITDYVEVGVENTFEYEAAGTTNINNYHITPVFGTLSINKVTNELVVTANSDSKTYDGSELKNAGFTTSNVLVGADTVVATVIGSQTNAGTSDNVVQANSVHVMRGNVEVTQNYTLGTNVNGKLTVNQKVINISSAGGEWTYDSQAHSNASASVSEDTPFVNGEGVTFKDFASITDYVEAGVENTFTCVANEGTVLANYDIHKTCGTLKIKKLETELEITANSKEQTYNGSSLSANSYTVTKGAVQTNDSLSVVIEGSIKDAGTATNEIKSVAITRNGKDVSVNYANVKTVNGTLKVNKKEITLLSDSGNWVYDSIEHYEHKVVVKTGGWVNNEGASYDGYTSVINWTEDPVENDYTITANEGTLLDNYEITKSKGLLQISKVEAPLIVTANSKEQKYSGSALKDDGCTYTSGVVQVNDTLTATVEGSITDAGTAVNKVTNVAIMRGGQDVSFNYASISTANGELKVTPRSVTLTSASETFDYTSTAHSNTTVEVSGDKFVEGEGATYNNFASITDYKANGVSNTFDYALKANTKEINYSITQVYGTLRINKVASTITVTADGASKKYDGLALTCSTYTYTQNVLVATDTLTATTSGTITDVGSVSNQVTSVVIKRGNTDVTDNYTIEKVSGTLSVSKRSVTLTSATKSWEYDATSHSDNTVTVGGDGFVNGEGVASYSGFPSVIDVADGVKTNSFSYTLTDTTNPGNYTITTVSGTIKIIKVTTPIILQANSGEKDYDGSALTNSGFTIKSGAKKGNDVISATVSGTQTNAGSSSNTISNVKVSRGQVDATDNYSFGTHLNGTLKVNPKAVTCSWSSSDLGTYNGNNHYNNISASISNKVGTDDVKATIKVTLSGSTSATTTVINAGTYIATVESLSGTSAGNYKLPSSKPTQNYILSKASSGMEFEPGSITTDYSTSAVTKSFNAASGASGTVQYTITAGGTGFTLGTANNITAQAKQTAKTSYSITLKAYDPGDINHEPKTIENKTLTWTINKVTPTVSWAGVKDGYKLERNSSSSASYYFKFSDKGITYSTTNTDSSTVNLSLVSPPSGVSYDSTNKRIVIAPSAGTSFNLTVKATSPASTNYNEASKTVTIKIEISSLWWSFASGTVYLSPFNTNQEATENSEALSSTSTSNVKWLSKGDDIKSVVILGSASDPAIKPSSMAYWFYGLTQLNSFTGFNWVNFENVSNFTSMFENASGITKLELGAFTVNSTDTTTASMFAGCSQLNEIAIGTGWKKGLDACDLPGVAWLDSYGTSYLTDKIPTGQPGTYNLAKYTLDIVKPDPSVAELSSDDPTGFPDKIYFNDKIWLRLTTTAHEERYLNSELGVYENLYNESLSIDVVTPDGVFINYGSNLVYKQNGYQFVSWDVENTQPEDVTEEQAIYFIISNDTLTVNMEAQKHASAVQYSDGVMKFYYDDVDHTQDPNYLTSYNVKNTKINDETLTPSEAAAPVVPDWISTSYYPYQSAKSIVFDESFRDLSILNYSIAKDTINVGTEFNNMSGWFMNFTDVDSISGWENIPSGVVDTRYMFYGFKNSSQMISLDLSGFDMTQVLCADYMFANFGNNFNEVILPAGVSSSANPELLKPLRSRTISYIGMFRDASTLKNVTFGADFGRSDTPCSYEETFKNCVMLSSIDLRNCLNLGSTNWDTYSMLSGCVSLKSFIVGFGYPDTPEKSMNSLGLYTGDYSWRDEQYKSYSLTDPPQKDMRYTLEYTSHLHIGNNPGTPSAGGFGSTTNTSLDMEVQCGTQVRYNRTTSTIEIFNNYGSGEPYYSVRFYENYPFALDSFQPNIGSTPTEILYEDVNIYANYVVMGKIVKTPKLVKTFSKEDLYPKYTFYYDNLTRDDYSDLFPDTFLEFWNVVNTTGDDSPVWAEDMRQHFDDRPCSIEFDSTFKEFNFYYDGNDPVPFTGMANWFRHTNIASLKGLGNIPSGVIDIRNIFRDTRFSLNTKTLDLSKWDMSYVWYAQYAFYIATDHEDIDTLILCNNFSSKSNERYGDTSQINEMFGTREDHNNVNLKNVNFGDNFGSNCYEYYSMFANMPKLTSVNLGANFASYNLVKYQTVSLVEMFGGVASLISADISGLSSGVNYDMTEMFKVDNYNSKLTTVKFPNNKVNLECAEGMFNLCTMLTSVDFSNITFTGDVWQYSGMLTECYALGKIVVGSSWPLYTSFVDFGLDDWTGFEWYKGDSPWAIYDPTEKNSTYTNHSLVNVKVQVPDLYKNIASYNFGDLSGITEIEFNAPSNWEGNWFVSDKAPNQIIIQTNAGSDIVLDLYCPSDVFQGIWESNYPQRHNFNYNEQPEVYIYPELVPKVTPKAAYNYDTKDLTIYNDSKEHSDGSTTVWNITNDWSFPEKEISTLTIDSSFKECSQYWDYDEVRYKPFDNASSWFQGCAISDVVGLGNMSSYITNVSGMFEELTILSDTITFDMSLWDMSNIEDASYMFSRTRNLSFMQSIKVYLPDNFGSSANLTNLSNMFNRSSVADVSFGQNFAPKGLNYSNMFSQDIELHELDLSTFTSNKKVELSNMFTGCTYLSKVKLWGSSVSPSNMYEAFVGCASLNEVDMHNVNIDDLKKVQYMFADCKMLSKLQFGNLPDGTTTRDLGYDENYSNRGNWYALDAGEEEYIGPDISYVSLYAGVVYENREYVSLKIVSPSNVSMRYQEKIAYEFDFKVLRGSHVDDFGAENLSILYDHDPLININFLDVPKALSWRGWTPVSGFYDDIIEDDAELSAYFYDGKTAKAVLYGAKSAKETGLATDLVFVYDKQVYTPNTNDIINVYNVTNSYYDDKDSFPQWITDIQDYRYYPKRVVFDESFKDFKKYESHGEEITFDSMDFWFEGLYNCEFVGLENIAKNQIKSAHFTFKHTGPNRDIGRFNPYVSTLDLRMFYQDNLEDIHGMFEESLYTNILLNDNFGANANNIGNLYCNSELLEHVDMHAINTDNIVYSAEYYENAVSGLNSILTFKVGDNWHKNMIEVGFEEGYNFWVDFRGEKYMPSDIPVPNVTYKDASKYTELLGLLGLSNQNQDTDLNDPQVPVDDPEFNPNPTKGVGEDLPAGGEAAALFGVPLALAALGFRRRIRGKHVKIK